MKFALAFGLLAAFVLNLAAQPCDNELKVIMDDTNRQFAGKRVDSDTIMQGAECSGRSLISKFIIDSERTKANEHNATYLKRVKQIQSEILRTKFCASEELKKAASEVVWSYKFASGAKFADFKFSPADCESSSKNVDVCASEDMKKVLSEINSDTPIAVDAETTMVRASCEAGVLRYDVLLSGEAFYKLTARKKEELKELRYKNLRKFYCQLSALRHDTHGITWSYIQKDGVKFHDFKFTHSDCDENHQNKEKR